MRFFKSFLCVCVVLFTFTSYAYAAKYYVDYSNGSDANNGLSINSPFKHCPGDDNAIDITGSTNLSAGDTVIFKGGVQYNGRIDLDWSGSEGSVITYDGNTDGTWGTGKAIIDGQDTRNWGFYFGSARSYITIDNFEVRNIAHSDSANAHAGIGKGSSSVASNYITVQNCYVHEVGEWNNDGVDKHTGCGIKIFYGNNCLIDSNEITKTGFQGVQLYGAVDCTVSNNTIHGYIIWGIDLAGEYRTPTGNTLFGNTIYDQWQYDCKSSTPGDGEDGYWTGDCASNPHTDGIFVRAGSGVNPEGTVIEKNLFYNNKDFESHYDGTALIYLSGATNTIIRNNILINPHHLTPIRIEATGSGTEIYNNTIYSLRSISYGIGINESGAVLKNNIIASGGFAYWVDSSSVENNTTSDYNYFVGTSCLISRVGYGCAYSSLDVWDSTGHDMHSYSDATIASVKFKKTSGYPLNCATMDLSLQTDSPAVEISAGANWSSAIPAPPLKLRIVELRPQ